METKYYKPDIEEFYSGFEHEYFENGTWKISNDFSNNWYWSDNPHYTLIKEIFEDRIRVKYLDKEDIGSLGFICTGDSGNGELEFQRNINEDAWFEIDCCIFDIIPKIQISKWIKKNEVSSEYILFLGYIKNKSELKIILKQIGVTEL